jgi:dihydrofolate reductase
MRKLSVFNSVTLDGYFSGKKGDISWAHEVKQDPEWKAFIADNAKSGGQLLFGRVTYEMMVKYWPTPQAMKDAPDVAEGMNNAPKVVFSKSLKKAEWNNTKLVKGDLAKEVRKLKAEPGDHMVIMGSGSIVSQLAEEGLIDEYQEVVVPVVIGEGKTMFEGLKKKQNLKLTKSRNFANGNVVLWYQPT